MKSWMRVKLTGGVPAGPLKEMDTSQPLPSFGTSSMKSAELENRRGSDASSCSGCTGSEPAASSGSRVTEYRSVARSAS